MVEAGRSPTIRASATSDSAATAIVRIAGTGGITVITVIDAITTITRRMIIAIDISLRR